jgi:hypothetical protein
MDVAIIIAYFNFSGTPAREQALRQTLISLQRTADVFLVCHKTPISKLLADKNLNIIKVSSASILWQKERFFNLALDHPKPHHRYVCWSNADIIYPNASWVGKLKNNWRNTVWFNFSARWKMHPFKRIGLLNWQERRGQQV